VVSVAAGLGKHVNLRRRMTEFGRIHAGLHFEFLQGIDLVKDDIRVEIGIGVAYAVERVIVIHDAISSS